MTRMAVFFVAAACTGGAPAPPTHERYVLTRELVPTTATEARAFGIDLDGDAVPDNQLGDVLSSVRALFAMNFQALADTNQATQQIELVWPGETGDAEFMLDASEPLTLPTEHPPYLSVPGILTLQSSVLGSPLALELRHARVRIRERTETGLTGSIGGGLTNEQVSSQLLPAFVALVDGVVKRDCAPAIADCNCALGSAGADWLYALDATHDCAITLDEVIASRTVEKLLAPDVRADGIDMLSFATDFVADR